jgi:dynein heavy chain 2
MKYTLKAYTLDCITESKNDRKDPDKFPSQILCLCNSIIFTDRCEEAIRSGKIPTLLAQLKEELDSYTNVEISPQHSDPKVLELKLKDLILDLIHQIDILESLMTERTRNVNDWAWQKQLRQGTHEFLENVSRSHISILV